MTRGPATGRSALAGRSGVAAITRSTEKRLPRYLDQEASDEFVLSGSETLVRVLNAATERFTRPVALHGVEHGMAEYPPRIEGLYAPIHPREIGTYAT